MNKKQASYKRSTESCPGYFTSQKEENKEKEGKERKEREKKGRESKKETDTEQRQLIMGKPKKENGEMGHLTSNSERVKGEIEAPKEGDKKVGIISQQRESKKSKEGNKKVERDVQQRESKQTEEEDKKVGIISQQRESKETKEGEKRSDRQQMESKQTKEGDKKVGIISQQGDSKETKEGDKKVGIISQQRESKQTKESDKKVGSDVQQRESKQTKESDKKVGSDAQQRESKQTKESDKKVGSDVQQRELKQPKEGNKKIGSDVQQRELKQTKEGNKKKEDTEYPNKNKEQEFKQQDGNKKGESKEKHNEGGIRCEQEAGKTENISKNGHDKNNILIKEENNEKKSNKERKIPRPDSKPKTDGNKSNTQEMIETKHGNGDDAEEVLLLKFETLSTEASLLRLLKENNGFCSLKTFAQNFPITLSCSEILNLLYQPTVLRYMSLFCAAPTGEGMVLAKIKDLQVCCTYMRNRDGCGKERCSFLHLCEDYLSGYCMKGTCCGLSHSTKDEHNSRVLGDFGILKEIPEDLELRLVQNSFPCVCESFNSEGGCADEFCHRFHICNTHIKSFCLPQKCMYGHSFDTTHNTRLLKLYQCKSDNIKWQIISRTQSNTTSLNKNVEKEENKSKKKQIKIQAKDNVETSDEIENPADILKGKKEVVISEDELDTAKSAIKRKDKSKLSTDGRHRNYDIKADANGCEKPGATDDRVGNHDKKNRCKGEHTR